MDRFQQLNRILALATALVIAVILLIMVLYVYVIVSRGLTDPDVLLRLGLSWLPALFYLWALWTLRGLFRGLAESGLTLRHGLSAALSRIGLALICGAVATIVTAPVVALLTKPHHLGMFALSDAPALALAMIGVALMVLARVLVQAIKLQGDAHQLRDVLESFI